MKKYFFTLLMVVAQVVMLSAQDVKRVAILETVDKMDMVDYDVEFIIRAYITDAVNKTPGYEGYDRVDMDQINKEQNFQRTGMVSDADIRKIGEMTGASSIVVSEVTRSKEGVYRVTAKIIDIEKGRIENAAKPYRAITDEELDKACVSMVTDLLGAPSGNQYSPPAAVLPVGRISPRQHLASICA